MSGSEKRHSKIEVSPEINPDLLNALNAPFMAFLLMRGHEESSTDVDTQSGELVSKSPAVFFSADACVKMWARYSASRDESGNLPNGHIYEVIMDGRISPETRWLVHYASEVEIIIALTNLSLEEICYVSEELMLFLPNTEFYNKRRALIRRKLLRYLSPTLATAIEKHKALEAAH